VYGQAPNAENLAAALASFQATRFAPRNRVDDYRAGNTAALSAAEIRGLVLFENEARCSGCHAGTNYSDESFRNNGLTRNADIGRAEMTGRDRDFRLQKVPTLRELRATAPYLHDGSVATLREVIARYNAGSQDPMADTDIRPLELSNQEMLDLEAFLNALSAN
jgi:cytochrome c peroxidase